MTSRFVQVSKPDGPFEIVEREIPEPSPTQLLTQGSSKESNKRALAMYHTGITVTGTVSSK